VDTVRALSHVVVVVVVVAVTAAKINSYQHPNKAIQEIDVGGSYFVQITHASS
jgi:hypothetical protein